MADNVPAIALPRCPNCGTGTMRRKLTDERSDFDMGDGWMITVSAKDVPVECCDQCECRMSGPEAARVRHDAICRAAKFYTPADIKAVRGKLGMSQEDLAQLSGFGVATISRWELGKLLQNRSSDNLLFLIAESEEARQLLALKAGKLRIDPVKGRLKVKVTMEMEWDEVPDDRGSVDVWIQNAVRSALDEEHETTGRSFAQVLKLKWNVIRE